MCGYFCIGFKSFSDDTSLFSPNEYKKNDKITNKYRKPKNPKI